MKNKLKWTKADLAYFTKKIPVAERNDDWRIWIVNCLLGKKYSWMIWATIAICGWVGIGYLMWRVVVK